MSDLLDLSDLPAPALVVPALIGLVFLALPVLVLARLVRDRRRRRDWTPVRARLLATRTETHRSTDEDGHGRTRTRTVGRWEYRDATGATHTGEGDLDGVWLSEDGAERELDVLVDPTEPTRSQARTEPPGAAGVVVVVVTGIFGVIGVGLQLAVLRALGG